MAGQGALATMEAALNVGLARLIVNNPPRWIAVRNWRLSADAGKHAEPRLTDGVKNLTVQGIIKGITPSRYDLRKR